MLIEYLGSSSFGAELDIVDPGNCCIKATDAELNTYYLTTKAIRGVVHILEYGPIFPDSELLPENFKVNYSQMKFNEKKLYRVIFNFLNDYKKKICEVEEDEWFNAAEDLPNIAQCFEDIK